MTDDRHAVRRTTGAALALGVSEIFAKIATFLMYLSAARLLGVGDFGIFSWGLSLGLLLSMIPSLGLDGRVLQLGSLHPEMLDRLYGALVAIRLVAFALVLAATTLVVLELSGWTTESASLILLVGACLLDPLNDACRSACGVLQRQQLPAVVMVVQRFLALALSIGPMVATHQVWVASVGYLIAVVIGNVGMFAVARRSGSRARMRGSGHEVRLVLRAAPVLGLEAMSTMGLFRIDAALIALMIGTDAVGIYGASYRIFETVLFVSWSLSRAFMPVVAARSDDVDHVRLWMQRWLLVVAMLYVPYGTVLFARGDDLVGFLYGPAYVSRGLMPALAFAPLLFGLAHLSGSVLVARRPDPTVVVASLAALGINIGLDVWLLPRVGVVGAGIATCAAFIAQAAISVAAVRRFTGPIGVTSRIVVVAVASGVAGIVMVVIGPVVPALIAGGLAYVGAWLVLAGVLDPAFVRDLLSLRARDPGPIPDLVEVTSS